MTIASFLSKVNDLILNPIILLLFGVAFLYFIYGIVKFLTTDAADKAREEARSSILWGIVGMVIMFGVYGIIYFVLKTFGIEPSDITSTTAKSFLKL